MVEGVPDVYSVHMRFMMFVLRDADRDAVPDESDVNLWVNDLDAAGQRIIGEVFDPASAAKLVRIRNGERLVTDGPVRQTEDVVGFDILECSDMDEAIELAARHPMARNGQLELAALRVLSPARRLASWRRTISGSGRSL